MRRARGAPGLLVVGVLALNLHGVSMGADDGAVRPTADAQVDAAVRRLQAAKAGVVKVLDAQCPDPAGWDGWLDEMVGAVAAVVGIADIDGALRKNGASPEKLRLFVEARGDDVAQLEAATTLRRKVEGCATATGHTAPSIQEFTEAVYPRADAVKRREERALGLEKLYQPVKRSGG